MSIASGCQKSKARRLPNRGKSIRHYDMSIKAGEVQRDILGLIRIVLHTDIF